MSDDVHGKGGRQSKAEGAILLHPVRHPMLHFNCGNLYSNIVTGQHHLRVVSVSKQDEVGKGGGIWGEGGRQKSRMLSLRAHGKTERPKRKRKRQRERADEFYRNNLLRNLSEWFSFTKSFGCSSTWFISIEPRSHIHHGWSWSNSTIKTNIKSFSKWYIMASSGSGWQKKNNTAGSATSVCVHWG